MVTASQTVEIEWITSFILKLSYFEKDSDEEGIFRKDKNYHKNFSSFIVFILISLQIYKIHLTYTVVV